MCEIRRNEAIKAMKLLGVDEKNLTFLGYPDFGTFTIFKEFWQNTRPFKSILTRISSVPYKENFSFGAPYKGESILSDLENIIKEYKPNKIFVSHPADANVDHKAFYLFLEVALHDLEKEIPKPKVYPYLVHCIGWPLPRHYHPQLDLNPPQPFLGSQVEWRKFDLTLQQRSKKYQAILCYKSQTSTSAFYLLSFARKNELFGDYPEIELVRKQSSKSQLISYQGFSNMVNESKQANWDDAGSLLLGKGEVSYGLLNDCLVIRIDKKEKLNKKFSIQLYLFGYSKKTPFASMPKIRIITRYRNFKVFDGKKMVKPQGLNLELKPRELILKIPLKILGNPDFILTAVKTYAGILHTDTTSFREIIIE
jgi:LmbE family N-acetylglucosaminyl deacetylase